MQQLHYVWRFMELRHSGYPSLGEPRLYLESVAFLYLEHTHTIVLHTRSRPLSILYKENDYDPRFRDSHFTSQIPK
jgi:hypothetical protein